MYECECALLIPEGYENDFLRRCRVYGCVNARGRVRECVSCFRVYEGESAHGHEYVCAEEQLYL